MSWTTSGFAVLANTGGRFLITGKTVCHRKGTTTSSIAESRIHSMFCLLAARKKCTIWFVHGIQYYMFCSDEDKASYFGMVFKMERVGCRGECIVLEHGNVQHACGWSKWNHALRYHPYQIPEDLTLKDAVAFPYDDLKQCYGQKKRVARLRDVDFSICLMGRRLLTIVSVGI